MKTNLRVSLTLLSVCVGLSVTARANTIDLQVELGAPGVAWRVRPEPAYVLINPTGFDGIPLGGQRISVNGDFAGNEFVRVYTGRPRSDSLLGIDAFMRLEGDFSYSDDSQIPGQLSLGRGYFLDQNGRRVGPASKLIGYIDALGPPGDRKPYHLQILLYTTFPSTPVDVYGFHWNLKLPRIAGEAFTSDTTYLDFAGGPLGFGPGNIPRDIVPETGSTATLLLLALVVTAVIGHIAKRPGYMPTN